MLFDLGNLFVGQFSNRILASLFYECFLESGCHTLPGDKVHFIVLYFHASINEWKICHLIYAVPFKEHIET